LFQVLVEQFASAIGLTRNASIENAFVLTIDIAVLARERR
jgi:hypothetical protein